MAVKHVSHNFAFYCQDYGSRSRCTIGVYGDPHLLLCGNQNLITCSAPGRQIYMKNTHFEVIGYNRLTSGPGSGSQATTITKVSPFWTFMCIRISSFSYQYIWGSCQWPGVRRWFSPGTPVASSSNNWLVTTKPQYGKKVMKNETPN